MQVTVVIGEDEKQLDIDEGKQLKICFQMIEIPVETVVVKKIIQSSLKKK